MYQKTEAFILYSRNAAEADRIVTMFSRDYGKIQAKVKGIRNIKSRYGASLEQFSRGTFELYCPPKGGWPLIINCHIHDQYRNLKKDLKCFSLANYLIEVIDKLTPYREYNPAVFILLFRVFKFLKEARKKEVVLWMAILKFFKITGWQLQWEQCIFCQKKTPFVPIYFNAREGGIICPSCASAEIEITVPTWQYLKRLETLKWPLCTSLKPPEKIHQELDKILEMCVMEHIPSGLKSRGFLDKMKKGVV